jgi:ABC-2 type transport system permease protein
MTGMNGMNGLLTLLKLDATLAIRHRLLAVTIVVAVAFGLLIRFAVPSEITHATPDLLADHVGELELPTPTVLDPEARKPAFDQQMVPILFALDLCLLGFMFGAVMVLEDRQNGTIRAFRVAPAGALAYVTSKLGVNLGLSLINLVLLVGLAAPAMLAKPALVGLALLICAGMTLLGIGLAPLSRSLAQFFFPMIVIGLVCALPMYLVWSPARGLAWTRVLPTWHMLFGTEAIAFGAGRAAARTLANEAAIYGLVFLILAGVLALVTVDRRLLKEMH